MTRKPKNTQGAQDSLQGAQAPDQAEAPMTAATAEADPANAAEGTKNALAAPSAGGATPPAEPSLPVPTVLVTGPKRGRWRAGMHFTPAPTALPLDDLAPGVLDALQADPALTVQIVDAPY